MVYECKVWSFTLGEVRRLSVFYNWVVRSIFGADRDEIITGRRKVDVEEFHDTCLQGII